MDLSEYLDSAVGDFLEESCECWKSAWVETLFMERLVLRISRRCSVELDPKSVTSPEIHSHPLSDLRNT